MPPINLVLKLVNKMFKECILFIVFAIAITGCTIVSTPVRDTQVHLNQWVNYPVDQLIATNGLPDEVIRMDNKNISYIKNETWDSSHGLFIKNENQNVQQWNNRISAWALLYRDQELDSDGNYYACTQTYHVNSRGIIIEVKEGWASPDNQNPCYIRKFIELRHSMVMQFNINHNVT